MKGKILALAMGAALTVGGGVLATAGSASADTTPDQATVSTSDSSAPVALSTDSSTQASVAVPTDSSSVTDVKVVPQNVQTQSSSSVSFTPVTEICLWQLNSPSTQSNPFAVPQTLIGCDTSTAPTVPTAACGTTVTYQLDYYSITSQKMADDFAALIATKSLASAAQDAEFSPHDYTYPVATGATCPPPPPSKQECQTDTYTGVVTPANYAADGWYTEDGLPEFKPTSLVFSTPGASDKENLFHGVSVPLAGIQGLGYHVDNTTANPTAAYDLEVDVNGTSGYTTLVWEPYQQAGGTPVNADGTFTNIENGKWWSTHSIPGDVGSSGSNQVLVSLADIEAANPNAKIISYGIGQGSNNADSVSTVYSVGFLCGEATFSNFISPPPSSGSSSSTPPPPVDSTTPAPVTSTVTTTVQTTAQSTNPIVTTTPLAYTGSHTSAGIMWGGLLLLAGIALMGGAAARSWQQRTKGKRS